MLGFESCGVENEDIYSVFTLQSLLGGFFMLMKIEIKIFFIKRRWIF